MSLLVAGFLAAVVVVVVGLTAGTVLVVIRQRRSFARANEVVPGVSSPAPASWAGSHDPEARLHRRLRDAMAAVRAATGDALDGRALELRVELEQAVLALDESLVAVAALPAAAQAAPRARATAAVEDVERVAADLVGTSVAEAVGRLEAGLARLRDDAAALVEARSEVERLAAGLAVPPARPVPPEAAEVDPVRRPAEG